jgi:hypothetical protein
LVANWPWGHQFETGGIIFFCRIQQQLGTELKVTAASVLAGHWPGDRARNSSKLSSKNHEFLNILSKNPPPTKAFFSSAPYTLYAAK